MLGPTAQGDMARQDCQVLVIPSSALFSLTSRGLAGPCHPAQSYSSPFCHSACEQDSPLLMEMMNYSGSEQDTSSKLSHEHHKETKRC